ncbi:SHOCT domain-containing protein [Anaerotignum sp.]
MINTAVKIMKKTVGAVAKVSVSEVTKVADGVKAIGVVAGMVPSKKKSLAEVTEDLKRLKELKDLGILSEEEFEEKKKKYMEML